MRTSLIYFLTKIHKNPMSVRPTVSTIDSLMDNMAKFLDHYLQPIMKQLLVYLKDTTQFLNELTNQKISQTRGWSQLMTNLYTPTYPMRKAYKLAMKHGSNKNWGIRSIHRRRSSDAYRKWFSNLTHSNSMKNTTCKNSA